MEKQVGFLQPTMSTPSPGFTARVMARIEQHERAQARRRALIGGAILLVAAGAPFVVIGYLIVSVASQLVADPGVVLSSTLAVAPVLDILGGLLEALAVAALALAQVGSIQILLFAIAVCSLTFLWAAIVNGSFQWSPRTLSVGGSR